MATTSNNKLLIFIISVLLVTNIAMLVFFVWFKKPEDRDHKRSDSSVSLMLKEKLGFSETQMKEYETLRQQHREGMKPLFDSIRVTKEKFYSYLDDTDVSDTTVNNALQRIGDKQEQIDMKVFTHFRKVRAMCNDQQKPVFDTLVQSIIQRMIVPGRRGSSKERSDSTHHN